MHGEAERRMGDAARARQLTWTLAERPESFCVLIRDRDQKFTDSFDEVFRSQGVRIVRTPFRAPQANGVIERFIGSARRECLDHVIILNAAGLQRVLKKYVEYHERSRTHLALDKDAPISRAVSPPAAGTIIAIPQVGGLHHRYARIAA